MRIKKFNESSDEEGFDIEYINQCFAELSDEYDFEITEVKSGREYVKIEINLPRLHAEIVQKKNADDSMKMFGDIFTNTLPNLIKNSEELTKILKLAKISIDRLLDEYPNYSISFKEINDNFRTRVEYSPKSVWDQPKLIVTIGKK